MDATQIDKECKAALKRINEIEGCEHDTPEADELNRLVYLVKKYEELELTTFVASWQTSGAGVGVKALHARSGKAVVCEKYESQHQNAQSAIETLMKSESKLEDLIGEGPIPKTDDNIDWDSIRGAGREFGTEKKGKLIEFFETGMEGVAWALQCDNLRGYEGLEILEEGDILSIYHQDTGLFFSGEIKPNKTINLAARPGTGFKQQQARGRWVHWIQDGFEADAWADLFISGKYHGAIEKAHA